MIHTDCPDLRHLAGKRFRTGHDPAAEHEPGGRNDPWLLTIPCQHGEIYPHGADRLGFASKTRGEVARAVAALPGAEVVQEASDGMNITFPVDLFDRVAAVVKPRRKRRLSPEQRERLVAMGRVNLERINSAHVQPAKSSVPAPQTA